MQYLVLRAATALLIAITASAGVQATSPSNTSVQPQPNPVVLAAEIAAVEPIEPVKESTAAPTPNIEPIAQATPVPEETLISEELRQKEKELKVLRLQKYLLKHKSPMADNAQDFVDAAEQYNLDWKLVPAIAGVESTFGKHLIPGTYNAYGWGGGRIRFDSWRDGIYTISHGLAEKYVARGLETPYQMQRVYAPPSTTWGSKVTYFMNEIDKVTIETEDK